MTISCGSQIARCCAPRSHQAQLQKPGIALRKLRFAVRTAANQAQLPETRRNKMGTKKGRTDVRQMGGKYY